MKNKWFTIASILISLSICSGAFAAHALKDRLDPYSLDVYQKAAFYHLTQSLGLLMVALVGALGIVNEQWTDRIGALLFFGIIIFCGSLYVLALSQIKWLGAITPFGGAAMIAAWALLAWRVSSNN